MSERTHMSIAEAVRLLKAGESLYLDTDSPFPQMPHDPAQDVIVNDARAAFALPPIEDGHLSLREYSCKHRHVSQWWEIITPPTCAKCFKPVDSIECERDVHRQTHVLTVRCHGAVEMIELTDIEVESYCVGMQFGEAFAGGEVRGALPAASAQKP